MSHPDPTAPIVFLEQNDFSILLARCTGPQGEICVETLVEAPLTDPAAMEAAVQAVAPAGNAQVICSLRPRERLWHLASPAEAREYPGIMGLRQMAARPPMAALAPAWLASAQARDGTIPEATPWLAALASRKGRAHAAGLLGSLKLAPARQLSAMHCTVGALLGLGSTPTLLLEIGERNSQVLLVGRAGVMAATALSFCIESIADAVQAELELKYRGSAQKLFLADQYDFSEVGARIAARLAPALKTELDALRTGGVIPTHLLCSGLPGKQQWLASQLASVLGYTPVTPDFPAWCTKAGLNFAAPLSSVEVSPMWLGFLQLLATGGKTGAWQAEWLDVTEPKIEARPVPVAAPVPAPVATPAPAPAKTDPASSPAPKPEKKNEPVPVAKPVPAPAATPAAAAGKAPVPPAKTEPAALANPIVKAPAPVPAAREASVRYSAKPAVTETAQPVYKKPAVLVSIGLVLLLGLGGFFYLQAKQAETARLAAEKARAEQRILEEAERARVAELKARQEAEDRKKFEFTLTQKLEATEAARQQAETEARTQAAARLANARGRAVINTVPAGAMVTIGSLPPRPSPASFEDVRIGVYPVEITLAGYDPAQLSVEIRENASTEPESVQLVHILGALEVASNPPGLDFELRPANAFLLASDSRRSGKTPAHFADLSPGEYLVTFTRPGWMSRTEKVTVMRDGTAQVTGTFPNGTVKITSTPSGATVTQGGASLGTTPLTLTDVAPGELSYELELAGYQPARARTKLEGGASVALTLSLLSVDDVTPQAELDSLPVPIKMVQPEVLESAMGKGGKVDIEVTVDRNGAVKDARIVNAPNKELGKLCLAAAIKWKFKPATAHGRPVNVRVSLPFSFQSP